MENRPREKNFAIARERIKKIAGKRGEWMKCKTEGQLWTDLKKARRSQ